jgi:uncharacterized membrane protein YfcA
LESMNTNMLIMLGSGFIVGIGGAFSGLGGGFLMVPFLLILGYTAQKSVGTSFLAIIIISVSALLAHNKLANVDYRAGILLGIGGIMGAQIGARLVEHVSTAGFKKIFALLSRPGSFPGKSPVFSGLKGPLTMTFFQEKTG